VKVSWITRHPLAAAMRAAARSPGSESASPPSRSALAEPTARESAALRIAASDTADREGGAFGITGPAAASH
jgi:hypothetical protein